MLRPRARRDRGFSLLVVFLLVMVMVGVAAAVVLSTQEDLSVSGQDREQKTAFYAAEFAVALGKDFLANNWSNQDWTPVLRKSPVPPELCQPAPAPLTGRVPGTLPRMDKLTLFTTSGKDPIQYQYCIHNNAEDPAYFGAIPDGDTDDTQDIGRHLIVIEGYGFYGSGPPYKATAHVTATVGTPVTQPVTPSNCYSEEGGCGQHSGNGGGTEAGVGIDTSLPIKGI
jgi:hypothetical protein